MDESDAREVDGLFNRVLHTEDEALTAAVQASRDAGLPPIEVSAQAGRFLSLLARATGARRVLEIGTLGGYSTICLARGVGPDGRVVTLEFDPKHADIARANLARAGMEGRVEVIVGAALDSLPGLAKREPFDMFFIDADKENNKTYVEWAIKLGRPGSVILVDNVVRAGRVLKPAADDHQARGVRDMIDMMGQNPRLESAAIQTVGTKGWDGFALALVK